MIFKNNLFIIYLVDLIKQLWEYNFSNISKVIAPYEINVEIVDVFLYNKLNISLNIIIILKLKEKKKKDLKDLIY